MKLKLGSAAERAQKALAAWLQGEAEKYSVKRRVYNAQRAHPHPAMMTPSRRGKLRRN